MYRGTYNYSMSVPLAPSFNIDFTLGVLPADWTLTRAGVDANCFDKTGVLVGVAANLPRFDFNPVTHACNGLLCEINRTNLLLYNRDMTITHALTVTAGAGSFTDGETVTATGLGAGAYIAGQSTSTIFAIRGGSGTFTGTLTGGTSGATKTISSSAARWTASSMTVARTATGIDGAANTASTLTASGANGTVLQALTSASSVRVTSFYIRRRTGTGTVEITQDNGSTWTPVTLTSLFQRFQVTATATNPTIGVRIVTSTDAIDVDYGQHELASGASMPIATTTASVARGTESITLPVGAIPCWNPAEGTLYVEGLIYTPATDLGETLFCVDNGASQNRWTARRDANTTNCTFIIVSGNATQASLPDTAAALTVGTIWRSASRMTVDNFACSTNGRACVRDLAGAIPVSLSTLRPGRNNSGQHINGALRRIRYWPHGLDNTRLERLALGLAA